MLFYQQGISTMLFRRSAEEGSLFGLIDAEQRKAMIKLGGVAVVAGILSHLKVTTADEVATDLTQRDQGLAQQILDEMLPFERLVQADSRSLQTLVREAEAQKLMLALAGAAKDTRDAFLGCLSSRARLHFIEEMSLMGPARRSDVEEARRCLSRLARELADQDRFTLPVEGYIR